MSRWLALGLAFLAVACGPDAADGDFDVTESAMGQLALGPETYAFRVDGCSTGESASASRPILTGHGVHTDGRSIRVTLLQTRMETTTWQSIGLDLGSGYWEARRGSSDDSGQGWWRFAADSVEAGLGPLFDVRGDTLRAEGWFMPGAGSDLEARRGTLTARCPQS